MSNNVVLPTVHHTVCDRRTLDLAPGTHCECGNEEPNRDPKAVTVYEPTNLLPDTYFSSLNPRPQCPLAGFIEWQFITPSAPGAFSPSLDEALGSTGVADAVSATHLTYPVGTDAPVPSFRF